MAQYFEQFIGWLAPILSVMLTTYATTLIARGERKRDEARAESAEKRKADAEWRERLDERMDTRDKLMDERMDKQDERIKTILTGQCTQMRSDLIHKSHRYVDDLGCASTEEKEAFWAEYEDYVKMCEENGVVNHFIDKLSQQVMALPNRKDA